MTGIWAELGDEVARRRQSTSHHLVIGVDGPDGSGKTMFASTLRDTVATIVDAQVTVVGLDDFHHPRAHRYRLGRDSPEGFFRDSYNYTELFARVLKPVTDSEGNPTSIVPGYHDVESDQLIEPAPVHLARRSVIILEGIFLHRDEIVDHLDFSIFLDVPFAETAKRMSIRDGSHDDPDHPSMRRYVAGQHLYFDLVHPKEKADLVIDNSRLDRPRIVRHPSQP